MFKLFANAGFWMNMQCIMFNFLHFLVDCGLFLNDGVFSSHFCSVVQMIKARGTRSAGRCCPQGNLQTTTSCYPSPFIIPLFYFFPSLILLPLVHLFSPLPLLPLPLLSLCVTVPSHVIVDYAHTVYL